jgi:hypothetical protein
MGQFDVDFDTCCVHVAERKQEELKAEGKHPHHQLTKRMVNPVVAPPGDVRLLLGDKVKTIGGTAYEVKCAGTTPAPMDVDINSVIYLVKMVDCIYRVSTNNHSEATGALIDRGANGGIAGQDCRVIEVNDQPHQYVNVEGIDGHIMERRRLVTAGAVIRNLPTSGLDSGSSWLDGVNGILMQQEPDLAKQDYWNRRAIASLANTLITVMEPVPTPLLSSMLLLQL